MIPREKNPDYINSFLDYSITILNKSPNSVKEYNYDLNYNYYISEAKKIIAQFKNKQLTLF